ncbi:hypothetical protein NECAME_13446, partial [Necator americanus]
MVTDQRIPTGIKGTEYASAVAAVRFAKLTEEDEYANAKLKESGFAESDLSKKMIAKGCVATTTVSCVKSIFYDGTGSDNNKDSCTGAYCTSVEGKLNGRKYVERGCSPISPYQDSTCLALLTNTSFHSGPGDGGSLSRTKRSLDAILEGTQCICSSKFFVILLIILFPCG